MKKQFLILFAFISVLAFGQSTQRFYKVLATGDMTSPKFIKTGSTIDSVLLGNGSARAISTIKTDTTSLSNRINTKQDALVSGTNIRTVNGNSILGSGNIEIVSGGGGNPANVYLSNVASIVAGYKNASPTIDVSETVKTITATSANTITWGEKYLYISPVATTIIPSGFWELHMYGRISTTTGVSRIVFRVLRYSGTTETVLATFTGFEVNNITTAEMIVNGSTGDIAVLAGDYIGIQVGFLSDGTSPTRTLTYTIGNGLATHFNTPLPTRHAALRDKNGEVDFQHLTAAQISTFNGKQNALSGWGFVKSAGGIISYDLTAYEPSFAKNTGFNLPLGNTTGTVLEGRTFGTAANSAVGDFQPAITGLTTNYLPKWNGSSMVNSLISDLSDRIISSNNIILNNSSIDQTTNKSVGALIGQVRTYEQNNQSGIASIHFVTDPTYFYRGGISFRTNNIDGTDLNNPPIERMFIDKIGDIKILSTTHSTSPTTGALVVGGGIGADHVRANNFYGSGSNLTGVQFPITLTTNGTSGAATFSGNVLNVPNYAASGGVNQTQTTVNGSTSGSAICAMPFQTGSYKKVMIRFELMNGNITYTFPTAFSNVSRMFISASLSNSSIPDVTATYITVTGAGNSGWLFIEGY